MEIAARIRLRRRSRLSFWHGTSSFVIETAVAAAAAAAAAAVAPF